MHQAREDATPDKGEDETTNHKNNCGSHGRQEKANAEKEACAD